jgi:hypothetical protein
MMLRSLGHSTSASLDWTTLIQQGSTAPAVATASDGVPSEYTKAHEKSSPMQRLMANAKRKHREMTENVASNRRCCNRYHTTLQHHACVATIDTASQHATQD